MTMAKLTPEQEHAILSAAGIPEELHDEALSIIDTLNNVCDECGHHLPHEHGPDGACLGCGTDEEDE